MMTDEYKNPYLNKLAEELRELSNDLYNLVMIEVYEDKLVKSIESKSTSAAKSVEWQKELELELLSIRDTLSRLVLTPLVEILTPLIDIDSPTKGAEDEPTT